MDLLRELKLIVKPLDENRILLERVPRLSEFFVFWGKLRLQRSCWRIGNARFALKMRDGEEIRKQFSKEIGF
jgi:hypothetical protein